MTPASCVGPTSLSSAVRWRETRRLRRSCLSPRGAVGLVFGIVLVVLFPISAQAATASAIASTADSPGPVVVDSSGNGYVAWLDQPTGGKADPVMFCKVPAGATTCAKKIKLSLPSGETSSEYGTVQPFPVLGGVSGMVYVVGPRYVQGDSVIWTSSNGGKTFSTGQEIPVGSYADLTSADDVLRDPGSPHDQDYFDVASHNPGLGYAFTSFVFTTSPVPGAVVGSTLGISGAGPVEAFWTDATPSTVNYFWAASTGSVRQSGWNGPTKVSVGLNARLAGGPNGLFLLSEDGNPASASKSLKLDVRKWSPSTATFGAPTLVGKVSNDFASTNQGGFTEDSADGALYVAWPVAAKGGSVMHLWTSSNDDTKFSAPVTVASIKGAYTGPARLAVINGSGFLTFEDGGGLELTHLTGL